MKIQYYKIKLSKPLQVSKELNTDIHVYYYYYYYYYYYAFSVIMGSNPEHENALKSEYATVSSS